jgi:hypothetical protein
MADLDTRRYIDDLIALQRILLVMKSRIIWTDLYYKHLYQFSVLHNIVHISLHLSVLIRPSSGVFYTVILLFYCHASLTLASVYRMGFFVSVNYKIGKPIFLKIIYFRLSYELKH